jgi:Fur family ferric uptake transcriptional regulator
MTVAPRRVPLVFGDLDEAFAELRARGSRLTSARRVLLEALFAADGLVSAEYIADGMDGRFTRSDVSSVYRNLERLEQVGIVCHVHLGHGAGLYALERGGHHEYLVCEGCDRVDSVPTQELDAVRTEIAARFGYDVRFSHFPLVGLCAGCARGAPPESSAGREHRHAGSVHRRGPASHGVHTH